jgi:hypothetical protein
MAESIKHPVLSRAIDELFLACDNAKDEESSVDHLTVRTRSMGEAIKGVREDTRATLAGRIKGNRPPLRPAA